MLEAMVKVIEVAAKVLEAIAYGNLGYSQLCDAPSFWPGRQSRATIATFCTLLFRALRGKPFEQQMANNITFGKLG
ncbi:hypothetical protein IFM89_010862 [Coptis chinensis]|uniref:Uncharacterized protein n=1 Tax=Coptis chinensis TaxID=261450 RepID=A0A835HZ09_9MAGN|nr:hypothetical protein IFM89_010862 [Coptis chinensis]